MEPTIFEKIIARDIPADIVYEDDLVLAFLDIAPIHHGHTLVIPKKKFINIFDGDSRTLGHMMQVAQKIAVALKAITNADGINIVMNNEEAAGQKVFHAHLHIIPRFTDDHAFHAIEHRAYDAAIAQEIVASLREKLPTALQQTSIPSL